MNSSTSKACLMCSPVAPPICPAPCSITAGCGAVPGRTPRLDAVPCTVTIGCVSADSSRPMCGDLSCLGARPERSFGSALCCPDLFASKQVRTANKCVPPTRRGPRRPAAAPPPADCTVAAPNFPSFAPRGMRQMRAAQAAAASCCWCGPAIVLQTVLASNSVRPICEWGWTAASAASARRPQQDKERPQQERPQQERRRITTWRRASSSLG